MDVVEETIAQPAADEDAEGSVENEGKTSSWGMGNRTSRAHRERIQPASRNPAR